MSHSSHILAPEFSRVHDWLGTWAMEPRAFELMVQALRRIDLIAHVNQPPTAMLSAMEKTPPARNGQSIAIIKMAGTLMKSQSSMGGTSTVQLRRDIRQAALDQDVGGILLAIDSPGGTTAGTDDLANEVKAARRMKPVIAHIDDLGASAAYWVASQAQEIYANSPTAMVGSIGTFITVYDSSEAAAKEGVKAYHFATGPLKGAGAPGTQLTEEQRAHLQSLIEDSQKTFDDAVRRGRSLTDRQLAEVRTGGVFLAESAMGKKLIDGVRPLSKTIDEMMRGMASRTSSAPSNYAPELGGGLPAARGTLTTLPAGAISTQGAVGTRPGGHDIDVSALIAQAPGGLPMLKGTLPMLNRADAAPDETGANEEHRETTNDSEVEKA